MKPSKNMLILCILFLACGLAATDAAGQGCCLPPTVGDCDQSGGIDITDISVLIDNQFLTLTPLVCEEEGDVDFSGVVDITDLSILIDNQFLTLTPLAACPSPANDVFVDEYASGVTYEAFEGSFLTGVQVSTDSMYAGTQGLELTLPDFDPWWAGGAFTDSTARDLSGFTALTFWAKASQAATIDAIGVANDNTGTSKYQAEIVGGMAVTTDWTKYVIPLPLPEKLTAERGMLFFAEGFEGTAPYQIWMDEVIFEDLGTVTTTSAAIATETFDLATGATVAPSNGTVVFDIDGSPLTMSVMPGYFTFLSSDPGVVSVGLDGVITAVGEGTATLTADLGTLSATGTLTVNVTAPVAEPATPAPTPTHSPDSVVSLFSGAYVSETVDTWSATWPDDADVEDYLVGGTDSTKKYTNLVFAGIEFWNTGTVDASAMTHFHMDVWTPDPTDAPAVFKVKLVDFGADGLPGGTDANADTEQELIFDETTMNTEEWVGIDVPLASFTGLAATNNLAQMIISGDPNTVYVDNVYFYEAPPPAGPQVPAPKPQNLFPGDVISVFSDGYTDIAGTTFDQTWDHMGLVDSTIDSDNVKKYTFGGEMWGIIQYAAPQDGTTMTHFHIDLWTPDPTDSPNVFKVKLVDWGADGVYGNGDDTEYEEVIDHNTMVTGSWVSVDIDLSSLPAQAHLAQLVLSGTLSTVWIDNMYFYAAPTTSPTSEAPTPPVRNPGDVISVFSDAYTDLAGTIFDQTWDHMGLVDSTIGSDNVKKYTFGGEMWGIIEYAANQDASAMTHFHVDLWTPESTVSPNVFRVKIVDFGDNGIYGDDDAEYEEVLDQTTIVTGHWVSVDIDLTSLPQRAHLRQLVLSGTLSTMWVDNMYFYTSTK